MTKSIPHPDFALRMQQACEGNPNVPQPNYGRLGWFVSELETGFGINVTVETVRKWFAGESRPRHRTIECLAEILDVEIAWFAVGTDNLVSEKQREVQGTHAAGIVNVIAGLIQLDGGAPAYPGTDSIIDLSAVIKAALYNFHIVLGSVSDGNATFVVNAAASGIDVLGVLRTENFGFAVYKISSDNLASMGVRKKRHVALTVPIATINTSLHKIESFATIA